MQAIRTLGPIAKSAFQVHAIDAEIVDFSRSCHRAWSVSKPVASRRFTKLAFCRRSRYRE